jgi:hypothetical protein
MISRESIQGAAGDVLPREVHRPNVDCRDQGVQIFGGIGTAEILRGDRRITETAEVNSEHTVLLGEQRDDFVERPPRLRKTVDEQDGRPVDACGDVVECRTIDVEVVMADLRNGPTARGDGGAGNCGHDDFSDSY